METLACIFFTAVQRFERDRRGLLHTHENRVARFAPEFVAQCLSQKRLASPRRNAETLIDSVDLHAAGPPPARLMPDDAFKRDDRNGGLQLRCQLLAEESISRHDVI